MSYSKNDLRLSSFKVCDILGALDDDDEIEVDEAFTAMTPTVEKNELLTEKTRNSFTEGRIQAPPKLVNTQKEAVSEQPMKRSQNQPVIFEQTFDEGQKAEALSKSSTDANLSKIKNIKQPKDQNQANALNQNPMISSVEIDDVPILLADSGVRQSNKQTSQKDSLKKGEKVLGSTESEAKSSSQDNKGKQKGAKSAQDIDIFSMNNDEELHFEYSKNFYETKRKLDEQKKRQEEEKKKKEEEEEKKLAALKLKSEKEKKEQLNRIKQEISGKTSTIWVVVVSLPLDEEVEKRINTAYGRVSDDKKAVPILYDPDELSKYLDFKDCIFKVISDVRSMAKVIQYKGMPQIVEFQIYNSKGSEELEKAIEFKSKSPKVKGIFTDWSKVLDRVEEEIDEENALFTTSRGIKKKQQKNKKFPTCIFLSKGDKSEITNYRINLFAAISLSSERQKLEALNKFLTVCDSKYKSNDVEIKNIVEYKGLEHEKSLNENEENKILEFYSSESFLYQVVNASLKALKGPTEFQIVQLPFQEIYSSIKRVYEKNRKQTEELVAYSVCKMRKKDFENFKKGHFIETLGFLMASKSQVMAIESSDIEEAENYMFIIHVLGGRQLAQNQQQDHGFVDLEKLGVNKDSKGKDYLFNALNIYKVSEIEQKGSFTNIHLQYGAIFDLQQKPTQQMTAEEYETLVNFKSTAKICMQIECKGDALMLQKEYQLAEKYFSEQLSNASASEKPQIMLKLAEAKKKCGDIDAAQEMTNEALSLYQQTADNEDRQVCMKVFEAHKQNSELSQSKEDFLKAEQDIENAIEYLSEYEPFEKAMQLKERGKIRFQKGDMKESSADFQESLSILQKLKSEPNRLREQASSNYWRNYFCLICGSKSKQQIQEEFDSQMEKASFLENKIQEIDSQIGLQMIRVNEFLKEVSVVTGEVDNYQECLQRGREYFRQMQSRQMSTTEQKAIMLAMKVETESCETIEESTALVKEALEIIEQADPYDKKVAQITKMMGKKLKEKLEKVVNPQVSNAQENQSNYVNSEQREKMYEEGRKNLEKALNVLNYNKRDEGETSEIVNAKNMLGELSLSCNKYVECEKTINNVLGSKNRRASTEIAKSFILKAKLSFSRGQLKYALQIIDEASKVLEDCLVNIHMKDPARAKLKTNYLKILQSHEASINAMHLRAEVYCKQLNYDMSLKSISDIESVISEEMGESVEGHPISAKLLELRGRLELMNGNFKQFDRYVQESIELRSKQFGRNHPLNAACLAKYAVQLSLTGDQQCANRSLNMAVQILTAYDEKDPNFWALFFSQACISRESGNMEQSVKLFEKSLSWTQKNFDTSHILIKELMLAYGISLSSLKKKTECSEVFQQLGKYLEQDISESNLKSKIEDETDDQKIGIKKKMYLELTREEKGEQEEDFAKPTKVSYRLQDSVSKDNLNRVIPCQLNENELENAMNESKGSQIHLDGLNSSRSIESRESGRSQRRILRRK